MSFQLKSLAIAGAIAVALSAAAIRPASAQAADLFSPVKPADASAIADARPIAGAAREAYASLNADALSTREIHVKLFPGAEATYAQTGSEPAYGGGVIWTGSSSAGTATLVLADGGVVGSVTLGTKTFKIEQVKGKLHKIAEIGGNLLPPDGPLVPAPENDKSSAEPAQGAEDAAGKSKTTTIKVLMAYTPRSAAASSNINSELNLAVSLANQAYATGGVKIALKLAGTIGVKNYDELSSGFGQVLNDVTNNTTPFQPVNAMRDDVKADLVSVIQEGTQYCGIAWYVANPSASTANRGFSTVSRGCITYYSVAHEMGHNMGLNHDRYVYQQQTGTNPPKSQYNFGFSNVSKLKRSIMAYANECFDKGVTCDRINVFSDPDVNVSGQPFGKPQGKKGAADNARRLNETRQGVASYR